MLLLVGFWLFDFKRNRILFKTLASVFFALAVLYSQFPYFSVAYLENHWGEMRILYPRLEVK